MHLGWCLCRYVNRQIGWNAGSHRQAGRQASRQSEVHTLAGDTYMHIVYIIHNIYIYCEILSKFSFIQHYEWF